MLITSCNLQLYKYTNLLTYLFILSHDNEIADQKTVDGIL